MDILTHDAEHTTCVRAATVDVEIVAYHLNGGNAPQVIITLTEALIGNADYVLSGEITELSDGGQVVGLCSGGGASPAYLATGPFSDTITTDGTADGMMTFAFRGLRPGTEATIINVSLTPA